MADPKIRIRRSATPNKVPSTTQLQLGELAINTYDGKVYLEQDQGGVGVGTTVIAINPWSVGVGSTAYNTHFLAGKAGIGTTNAQYNLDVGGNINFTGNLYQDGTLYTSGTTGIGIGTAGGVVGYAATIVHFKGPGVTTAYYSSATGIGTINFHSVTSGGGGGGASVTVSDSAPSSPSNGDLWFKSDVGELYVYYADGSSNQWVEASGGSNTCVTSDTAPPNPQDGDLWWNSNTGELKIYYNDGNSSQWVDANSEGGFIQYWTQYNTNGTLGVHTTGFVGIGTTTATDALTVKGNVNVTGVATFSGDVKVGGVLTYEDVKNVDAIGVVTARTGLKVLAGGATIVDGTTSDELNVTGVSTFAGNVDVNADLDVDGITNLDDVNISGVTTATGGVKVGTAATICSEGNMTIDRPSAGIITATKFIGDGSELTGVISGIGIGTEGGVVGYAATIVHFKGPGVTTAYYSSTTGVGTVYFQGGGGGGGANVTVSDTPPGSPSAGDLWWESDIGELKIYYSDGDSSQWVDASGADSLVQIGTSAPTGAVSGDLWWNSESGDLMVYYTDANSSAWISVNAVNSERIWATNSTGINTTRSVGIGTTTVTDALTVVGATDLDGRLLVSGITTFGSHVYHGDGDRAIFGDGSDLEIYHSGSDSIIRDARTSGSVLKIGADSLILQNKDGNEKYLEATDNGSVDIMYDFAKKFSTTAGGAKVWGTVGSANTALVVVGDARITGILTVGTGSLTITDRDIKAVGVITGANFKSGTTNVHNVGVEAAGINVLGADTPIGTGATVYNSGLIVGKQGAEFQGVVTASNFSGNITNPSNDITTRNLKVTGLSTFVGNAQFDANVNILGTLTYEDVKNVDSVGIATARQGLRITGGGLDVVGVTTFNDLVQLSDDDKIQIGTGNDLEIYHSSNNSFLHNNNGRLRFEADNLGFGFYKGAGAATLAMFNVDAECSLRYNNQLKFETMDSGVKVSGITSTTNLNVVGVSTFGGKVGIADSIVHTGNENTSIRFPSTSELTIETGGAERFRIDSIGRVGVGTAHPKTSFEVRDAKANVVIAKDGLTIKQNNDISSTYDILQIGAGGALASYSTATVTADTQFVHNAYRHSGHNWKYRYADSAARIRMNSPQGAIIFDNAAAGSADGDITFSERLRIDSAGNMGLGVVPIAPGHTTLHIGNSASSQPVRLHMTTNGTGATASDGFTLSIDGSSGAVNFIQRESANMQFYTAGTERVRFANNSAAVSIGGALQFNSMLTVQGDISGGLLTLKATENTNRFFVSGTNSNGCEVNLYDDAGGQKGIMMVNQTEFSLKAPNSAANFRVYTTPSGGSATERLRIVADGGTSFTRLTNGGTEAIGNDPNKWFKIGTWAGSTVDAAARATLTIIGAATHNSNANVSGETKIHLAFSSNPTLYGYFYSTTAGYQGISGVAHKYNSGTKSAEIWVKYQDGYGSIACYADVTNGFFTGEYTATGSTSTPSGATVLESFWSIRTSDGSTNYERIQISPQGVIRIGGATDNSSDIDSSHTKVTIKQSANNQEDGIYLERSGERRGYYMYVGGAGGLNDALCITTNQLGTDTHCLAIDRGNRLVKLGGEVIIDSTNNGYGGLRIYDDSSGDYNVRYIAGRNQSATAHVFMDSGRNQNQTPWTAATAQESVRLTRAKGIQFQGDTDTWFGAAGADGLKWQTEGTDVAYMTNTQVFATAKHATKVTGYSPVTTHSFGARSVTKFFMEFYTGNSSATYHFCRQISQPDWSFDDMEIKQSRHQYSPAGNDKATRRYYTWYSSHTEQITNYNQNGSTSGGGAENWIGKNQNLGPGGAWQIHENSNGGYYRDAWGTDYYVSLGNYIGVRLEITIWTTCGLYDTGTYATASDFYPAAFGGSATQSAADNWGGPRGTWFNTTAQGTGSGSSPGCLDPWSTGSNYGQTADP